MSISFDWLRENSETLLIEDLQQLMKGFEGDEEDEF